MASAHIHLFLGNPSLEATVPVDNCLLGRSRACCAAGTLIYSSANPCVFDNTTLGSQNVRNLPLEVITGWMMTEKNQTIGVELFVLKLFSHLVLFSFLF